MTAYDLGKQAWEDGKTAVPVHDRELRAILSDSMFDNIDLYKEWLRGWHEANAAATMPGVTG